MWRLRRTATGASVYVASAASPPFRAPILVPTFLARHRRASSLSPPFCLESRSSSVRRPAPETEERCSGTGDVGRLHTGYVSLDGRREDVGWGSENGLAARPCSLLTGR